MLGMTTNSVTGLILAGGKGSRMGGLDKGLQPFNKTSLVKNALNRLQHQEGTPLTDCMIVANRNINEYKKLGVPVWQDSVEGFAGPLAGFLTGMQHCQTALVLTVPCDCPKFPLNLASKLWLAMADNKVDVAMVATQTIEGEIRLQPVFCMFRAGLANNLHQFMLEGGRKIETWVKLQNYVTVVFDDPADSDAFANANTVQELQRLEELP
jgi:molybdopterin-guanine dinucleotide biosynthesis protein A